MFESADLEEPENSKQHDERAVQFKINTNLILSSSHEVNHIQVLKFSHCGIKSIT